MTPPPFPPEQAKNSCGKPIIFPNQSSMTTSNSVHAGLAIQVNPIQAIAPLNMSATMAG